MAKDLAYYLAQARRIAEHREAGAEKEIRKIYRAMLKDLNAFVSDTYVKYAKEDKLTFAMLQKAAYHARFLEEIERRIGVSSPKAAKELRQLVRDTYKIAYDGMVDGVVKAGKGGLDDAFAENVAITPQQIKNAVSNPIMDVALEKNHKDVLYDIKQVVAVGLMNGDRYTTMARRIAEKVDGAFYRSVRIARTEAHRVREAGNLDAAKEVDAELQNGTTGLRMVKKWRTMGDNLVRPQRRRKGKGGWTTRMGKGPNHMILDGQIVLADQDFDLLDGHTAPAPGQSGIAGHDIHCRCIAIFTMMTDAEFFAATGKHFPGWKDAEKKAAGKAAGKAAEKAAEKATEKAEAAEKMAIGNYPGAFTKGAEKKNTQKFVDYVNGLEGSNADTIRLYNGMAKLESIESEGIPFKISHGKNSAIQSTARISTGELMEVKLTIPKLDGENLAGQVNTTLHEKMHLIDMYCRSDKKKANGWFSTTRKPLADAIQSASKGMSDQVSALFQQFDREYSATRDAVIQAYRKKRDDLRESYFPNGASLWSDLEKYRQYEKEAKKLDRWLDRELDYQCRNIMGGGVNALQDIYDALSGGAFRDNGTVKYGHGSQYYRNGDNRVVETLANYGALSVERPDLVEMLRADKPELVAELENTVKEMLGKVGD